MTRDPASIGAGLDPVRAARGIRRGERIIVAELLAVQGSPADLGGYYYVDKAKTDAVMRPSATFNAAIESP